MGDLDCRFRGLPNLPETPSTTNDNRRCQRCWPGNLYRGKELRGDFDNRKKHAERRKDVCDRLPLVLRYSKPEIIQGLHSRSPAFLTVRGVCFSVSMTGRHECVGRKYFTP